MIQDRQRSDFLTLINTELPQLFEETRFENDLVRVSFKGNSFDIVNPIKDNKGTVYNVLSALVKIENRKNNESYEFNMSFLNIPVHTSTGYIIRGNARQILDVYDRAGGWYTLSNLSKKWQEENKYPIHMELISKRKLEFTCKGGMILVAARKKVKAIGLGIFLKAISGLSYMDLVNIIGPNNKYIASTFQARDELSLTECINKTFDMIFADPKISGTENKLSSINNLLYSSPSMYLGPESRTRLRRSISFEHRALNQELAEEITVNGVTYSKGYILHIDVLRLIDSSEITSLKILHDNKIYDLRKYPVNETLTLNEFFTMLNVYSTALDGFDKIDSRYELTDRISRPSTAIILDIIKENMYKIGYHILTSVEEDDNGKMLDLITIASDLPQSKLNEYMERIEDSKAVEVQSSDTNNIISYMSKSFKITTKYSGMTPGDMIRIQDTQAGRLDPIDSPESQKIGLVHFKTILCKTDPNGFLVVPYLKVDNGVIASEDPIYLTADDEQNQYIAEWNEKFKSNKIKCRYNGSIVTVPKAIVKYREYSPIQTMSPARSQIPYQNHSAPKRLLMGGNQSKQAVITIKPDRPLVSTGCDCLFDIGIYRASDILADYYEQNQHRMKSINKDDFIKQSIKITGTSITSGYREVTFMVMGENSSYAPSISVPFLQKNHTESMYSYNINTNVINNTYTDKDIVLYNTGMDIKKHDIAKCVDFGGLKVDDEAFNTGTALGKNLIVAFKTHEASTMDDAIVISDELVTGGQLTSITLYNVTCVLKSSDTFAERFGFATGSSTNHESYITTQGVPEVGTYLESGSLVIAKYKSNKVFDGKDINLTEPTDKSIYLEKGKEGEVISTQITGDTAQVTLAVYSPIEGGDKLSGRYGNKGVIAKIIPASHMPFDPESGLRVQILLNPLGIPSRTNISQLVECLLGFSMKLQGKIAIVSPYHEDGLKFAREQADLMGIKPMMLRDGRTGQLFKRPINVGVMLMLKLEHMVGKRMHSVNAPDNLDPVFLQPKKGRKRDGGQAFGEMESWVLLAVGANKVLQEVFSIQSDDVDKRDELDKLINSNPNTFDLIGSNNNDHLSTTFFRCMGVDSYSDEEGGFYGFRPLTDSYVRRLAIRPLDTKNANSLHDHVIFGNNSSNKLKYRGRVKWGWIDLGCEIIHPTWISKGSIGHLIIIDKQITIDDVVKYKQEQLGQDSLNKVVTGKACIKFLKDGPVFIRSENVSGSESGIGAIVHLFKTYDLSKTTRFLEEKLLTTSNSQESLKIKSTLSTIKELTKNGLTLKDFIISTLPIMPQVFRPELRDVGRNIVQDFDKLYSYIFLAVTSYSVVKTESARQKIYDRLMEFVGFNSNDTDLTYKSLLEWFTSKDHSSKDKGKIRTHMLSKRVSYSGRTIIIPISDMRIKPTQIGIPILMCVEIYEQHLKSLFKIKYKDFGSDTEWEGIMKSIAEDNYLKFVSIIRRCRVTLDISKETLFENIKNHIIEFCTGKVVLAGRQPSLHKFSCRAFKIVVTFMKAIEIHPLVCKGYNADFDGDQMYVIALLTDEASQEALEKLSPSNNVINEKDGSAILEHAQDMKLGVYYATMLFDNQTSIKGDERYNVIRYYSSIDLMKDDLEVSILEPQSLVCYHHNKNGYKYLSTAGRILFNSLLPNGFTDNDFTNTLKITDRVYEYNCDTGEDTYLEREIRTSRFKELYADALISDSDGKIGDLHYRSLSKITNKLYRDYPDVAVETYFQDIMMFCLKCSDMSGISISLDDMVESPKTSQFIQKANEIADAINDDYFNGLLTASERKISLIEVYDTASKKLQNVFMKEFKRNNNLFIMKDSGARGNDSQIMQTCAMVGVMSKTPTETLETPVLGNYAQGITSFETYLASYGTRMGISSAANDSANAGYCTRQTVYMTGGFKIVEKFCGKEDWKFDLSYSEPFSIFDITNKQNVYEFLVGKVLDESNTKIIKGLGPYLDDERMLTDYCVGMILDLKFDKIIIEKMSYFINYDTSEIMTICNGDTENRLSTGSAVLDTLSGKRLSKDFEYDYLLVNFIQHNRMLTKTCIDILTKNKVRVIPTDEGIFKIHYRLDSLMKSMLPNREARNLKYLENNKEQLYDNCGFITSDTIDYIERQNFETIEVLTMLDCESIGGVCAHCYGQRYDTLELPKVGEIVGITSAQAIGEPSAQLVLSVINKGGLKGTNASSGVTVFQSLLEGNIPSGDLKALISQSDGYVDVQSLGNNAILALNGKKYKTDKLLLKYTDGEYVKAGMPLTLGYVVPDLINPGMVDSLTIKKRQMALYSLYYYTFLNSKIEINARHFEVLVRLQTGLVTIVDSTDDTFIEGRIYDKNSVLRAIDKGSSIGFQFNIMGRDQVIENYSGLLALLSFENIPENLARAVVMQKKAYPVSPLSDVFIGQDLTSKAIKKLIKPKIHSYSGKATRGYDDESAITKVIEISDKIEARNLVNTELNLDGLADMDLFSSVAIDLEKPITTDDDLHINVELEEEDPEEITEEDYPSFSYNSDDIDENDDIEETDEEEFNDSLEMEVEEMDIF